MDFSFSEKEEAFRREVREFLAAHNPNRNGGGGTSEAEEDLEFRKRCMAAAEAADKLPKLLAWNQALHEKRWVGFSWPREVGGGGGGLVEQMILKEECGKARSPMLGLS